jgi:hypothetical protein
MLRTARFLLLALSLALVAIVQAQLVSNVTLTQASSALLPLRKVQTHLKLTKQQKDSLAALFKGYGKLVSEIRQKSKNPKDAMQRANKAQIETANKALAILTAVQRTRLRQLGMQAYGIFSVVAPDVSKELGLTPAQVSSIKRVQASTVAAATKIGQEIQKAAATIPQPKDKNDKKAVQAYFLKVRALMAKRNKSDRKRMNDVKKAGEAKAMAVLSKAQREKWTAMQGPKFDVN